MPNVSCETLINTVVYEDFRRRFAKRCRKHLEKHWVSQSNLMHLRDIGESDFSLGKTVICGFENEHSKNLINTVVYEDFWRPFAQIEQNAPESIGFLSQT